MTMLWNKKSQCSLFVWGDGFQSWGATIGKKKKKKKRSGGGGGTIFVKKIGPQGLNSGGPNFIDRPTQVMTLCTEAQGFVGIQHNKLFHDQLLSTSNIGMSRVGNLCNGHYIYMGRDG